MGIFKELNSESDMNTQTIVERIIENRARYRLLAIIFLNFKRLAQAHEVKKKKLDDYYKSQQQGAKITET